MTDGSGIVQQGWAQLQRGWIVQATPEQIELLRCAFFAGARHIYKMFTDDSIDDDAASLMLTFVEEELEKFINEFMLENFANGRLN